MMIGIGLLVVLGCVFGSFMASGGAIGPLIASMPFELLTILGAAVGTFLMANSSRDIKHLVGGLMMAAKGSRYQRQDYVDLLGLMFFFVRLASTKGITAIEAHIEAPEDSAAFQAYPKILANQRACRLICDSFRMLAMNVTDPYQMDEIMARELKKVMREETHLPHALQSTSDALPALGIVAAVLGVIKTMASISKPPAVLGEMIAGALVGTFLGILLAYGIVAPIAARLTGVIAEEASYFDLIRGVLVAHMQGNAPIVSVEIGRKDVPSAFMPSFTELEEATSNLAITG